MGDDASDRVYEVAADLFSLLSTPTRLRIVCELCGGERTVGDLLERVAVSQPNMSQHLSTLYRAGVLGKRREGTQIFYRLQSERVATLCRAVCAQVAMELDGDGTVPAAERLTRAVHR